MGYGGRELSLVTSLSELAARVQRSRSVAQVAQEVVKGLGELGYLAAITQTRGDRFEVVDGGPSRWEEGQAAVRAVRDAGIRPLDLFGGAAVDGGASAKYIEDLPGRFAAFVARRRDEGAAAALRETLEKLGIDRAIACPLSIAGQPWGVLGASSRTLDAADVPAFSLFARQLTSALEAADSIESLEHRNRQLAAIQAIASAAVNAELDHLATEVLRICAQSTESDAAALWLFDASDSRLELAALQGASRELVEKLAVLPEGTITREVAQWMVPRSINVERECPDEETRAAALAAGFHEVALVPLWVMQRPAGVLAFARRAQRPYGARDLESAVLVAEQAAILLENARLSAAQRQRVQALSAINEVGALINERLELSSVLATGVRQLARVADVPQVFLLLIDEQARELRAAAVNFDDPWKLALPLDSPSAATACIRERRPVVIPDAPTDPRAHNEAVAHYGHRALVAVPLVASGKALGAVVLGETRAGRRFTQEEVDRAVALSNQLATAIANARLIEDLKASYARLERAQADLIQNERMVAVGELAAQVAHEVRNPVAVIFNALGALKKHLPDGGDVRLLLGIVQEEAERLNAMVGDFLDFARPNAPQIQTEELLPLLQASMEAALQAHEPGRAQVALHVPSPLPKLPVDARLLRQALINLVSNAIEARPRGGHVALRALVEGPSPGAFVRLEVTDDGPGLPPLIRDRLFQPFVTTKAAGTGLGLAVVKRIVESHRGEISVRSEPEGTTFVVRLPVAPG